MHNKYEMNILNTYDQKKMEDKISKQTKKNPQKPCVNESFAHHFYFYWK